MCAAQNDGSTHNAAGEKPLLRGKLHLYASFVALAGGIWLILRSASLETALASVIYSFALISLFAISAIYHVPTWPTQTRLWLKRLDHSAIFILIAGTATPIFDAGLSGSMKSQALTLIWTGAALGILQSVFWTKAPKAFVALLCVALGWLGAPYLLPLAPLVGTQGMWLLVSGGVMYSLGALVYALKRPNLKPGVFGYHELFHALVIVAAGLHYALIFNVITRSG
jgi:hemolysin III